MKTLADVDAAAINKLLQRIGLSLEIVSVKQKIPGSFWGDPEAGLIKSTLYASHKTPIHSILHEAGHYICMTPERRKNLHTNALGQSKGDFVEENAVCYLQILLADEIEHFGRENILKDMDAWGYSFRLGSAQKWFENDAEDASSWLARHRLLDNDKQYNFMLRLSN